jgi:SpoVK/Ycf46/Vps4 family AAA+-type ATPase
VLNKLEEAFGKSCVRMKKSLLSAHPEKSDFVVKKIFTHAEASQPSLILIDDLEALASPKSEYGGFVDTLEQEIRRVAGSRVQVVATASRPIDIDLKVLRCFRKIIELPIFTSKSRLQFLQALSPDTPLQVLENIAERTHAFTADDIDRLCEESYDAANKRSSSPVNNPTSHSSEVGSPSTPESPLLMRLGRTCSRRVRRSKAIH